MLASSPPCGCVCVLVQRWSKMANLHLVLWLWVTWKTSNRQLESFLNSLKSIHIHIKVLSQYRCLPLLSNDPTIKYSELTSCCWCAKDNPTNPAQLAFGPSATNKFHSGVTVSVCCVSPNAVLREYSRTEVQSAWLYHHSCNLLHIPLSIYTHLSECIS